MGSVSASPGCASPIPRSVPRSVWVCCGHDRVGERLLLMWGDQSSCQFGAELAAGLAPVTTEPLLGQGTRPGVTQGLGRVCFGYGCKNIDLFTCCAGGFMALWCFLTPSAGAVGQ